MKTIPKVILWIGIATCAATLIFAAGPGVALVSAVLFSPAVVLAVILRSRVRRKKVEEICVSRSSLSVGVWLIISSVACIFMTRRPGREAEGMFGVFFLVWPLVVSTVTCLLVAWHLPAKRITYH